MRWNRFFPYLVLTASLVQLTGNLRDPAPETRAEREAPSYSEWKGREPDAEARRWIDRAVEELAPQRVSWMETALWQKVTLPDITYQAEGRLLIAPEGRFRLELTAAVGGNSRLGPRSTSRLEVSDGINSWTARKGEDGEWVEVARRIPGQDHSEESEPLPAATGPFLPGTLAPGVSPLLADLRGRLRWVLAEPLPGGKQVRLTGLAVGTRSAPAPEKGPRLCRVILERESLWPARIEWWGPGPAQGASGRERLLVEMEFRGPVLNRPLPPDVSAREFSLHSTSTVITDLAVPFFPAPASPRQ